MYVCVKTKEVNNSEITHYGFHFFNSKCVLTDGHKCLRVGEVL